MHVVKVEVCRLRILMNFILLLLNNVFYYSSHNLTRGSTANVNCCTVKETLYYMFKHINTKRYKSRKNQHLYGVLDWYEFEERQMAHFKNITILQLFTCGFISTYKTLIIK